MKTKPEYISLFQFFKMIPDEEAAVNFYERQRWTNEIICPRCDSPDRVKVVKSKKPQPFHCGHCRKYFSVKVGTIMESSKIPLQRWLIVTYMMTTARKGISSCQIARELGITQKTAWFLMQRIRKSWHKENVMFGGEIEIDEAYFGGKEKNKHANKRLHAGRGAAGKVGVVGMKSRKDGRVKAFPIHQANKQTLHGAINSNVESGATVYSDDWRGYRGLIGYNHEAVKHSVGEYVRDKAHTNGIESFWAILKRGYYGIFHHFSKKHIQRYIDEFAERQNTVMMQPVKRFGHFVRLTVGKRLTYSELIQ